MLVLMSTIALYLAQYLKEQLEVCRQHFLCRIRTKGYSYSAVHLTSSRGTPVAEHWPKGPVFNLCALRNTDLLSKDFDKEPQACTSWQKFKTFGNSEHLRRYQLWISAQNLQCGCTKPPGFMCAKNGPYIHVYYYYYYYY